MQMKGAIAKGGDTQPYNGYFSTAHCHHLAEKTPRKIKGLSSENEMVRVIYHPLQKTASICPQGLIRQYFAIEPAFIILLVHQFINHDLLF